MLDQLLVYDDVEPNPAPLNMAVDEALLACAVTPVLRFYRWQTPSLSFGYFGRYAEAADRADGREIVRRWTGGGIVPHGDDLTYSVIIPASHSFFTRSSLEVYVFLHDAIRQALTANGVSTILANSAAPKVSEDCFANAVKADVMSDGRKIAARTTPRALLPIAPGFPAPGPPQPPH